MVRTTRFKNFRYYGISAFLIAGMVGGAAVPAQAGFFDQLFGGGQSQSAPQYSEPQSMDAPSEPTVAQPRRAVKRLAVDSKPVLQKPTDLMHDRTLQPGDAVMMKTGIHIYTGREGTVHDRDQFTPLDEASRLPAARKIDLAAMDGTRNDPLAKAAAPDTLASGRSASVSAPIVTGVKFTDKRGVIVRYVGP